MKLNIVSLLVAGSLAPGSAIGDDSRMMRKREKMSRKMGYGDVGSLTARQGSSLCSLRSTDPKFQCCDNVSVPAVSIASRMSSVYSSKLSVCSLHISAVNA